MAKKKEYRQHFDLCVSRAVSNLSTLSEYCLPFVALSGTFISYKSAAADEELETAKNAIFILGGKIQNVVKFQLPDSDMGRSLICIEKVKGTPKVYPRKAGTPVKSPLS
jgi:16S rRNA (guanine527-N7)-methyltransferase